MIIILQWPHAPTIVGNLLRTITCKCREIP